jgi:hypothetical protein
MNEYLKFFDTIKFYTPWSIFENFWIQIQILNLDRLGTDRNRNRSGPVPTDSVNPGQDKPADLARNLSSSNTGKRRDMMELARSIADTNKWCRWSRQPEPVIKKKKTERNNARETCRGLELLCKWCFTNFHVVLAACCQHVEAHARNNLNKRHGT